MPNSDHVIAKIAADLTELKADLAEGVKEFRTFGEKVKQEVPEDPFKRLKDAGKELAVVAGMAAPFVTAGKAASDFEKELANLNTIAEYSSPVLKDYGDKLRTISLELNTGTGAAANARAAYDLASAGFIGAADNAAVLETTLKAATAGNVDAAQAGQLLVKTLNAYGASAQESERYADVFFKTVKNGITTFPELSASMGDVVGIAAQAGIPIEELGAAMATTTAKGQNTSTAVDGLRGVITSLLSPTDKAKKELDRLGISVTEQSLKQKGLRDTLVEIAKANNGSAASFSKIVGPAQRLATALNLVGDGGKKFTENMAKSSGEMGAALDVVTQTFDHSMKQFKVSLEAAGVAVGSVFLPPAKLLLDTVTGITSMFAQAPEPIRDLITVLSSLGLGYVGVSKVLKVLTAGKQKLTFVQGLEKASTVEQVSVLDGLKRAYSSVADAAKNPRKALANLVTAGEAFAASTAGTVAGLAALAITMGIVAKAGQGYAKSIEAMEKAEADLIATQARSLLQNKEALKIRNLSIEQVQKQAKTFQTFAEQRVYLTQAIMEAQEALDNAKRSGDEADIKAARQRLTAFQSERAALDDMNAREVAAHKEVQVATEARFKASADAFKEFKKEFDSGSFDSKEKALAQLESIAGGLSGDSLKGAQKELRKLRSDVLSDELDGLKKRIAAEEVTADQAKEIASKLLGRYQANADQRKKAEADVTAALKSQTDKRASMTAAYLARDLELQKSALAQKVNLAQDNGEIASLESRLSKGEDVVDQLQRELDKRNDLLKTYVDEEAALERIAIKRETKAAIKADPKEKQRIEEQAAERVRQLDAETDARKASLDQEQARRTKDLAREKSKLETDGALKNAQLRKEVFQEELAGQSQVFAERRKLLEEQAALGSNVSAELKALAKEEQDAAEAAAQRRFDLAKEEIALKQQQADIGATPEQRALNAQRAQLEIQQAQRENRKELQAIVDQDTEKLKAQTAELVKQRELLQKQNEERKKGQEQTFSGPYDVTQINENLSSFGVGRNQEATTEDGRSVEDLDRQIARNRGILNSKQNQTRGDGRFASSFGQSRRESSDAAPLAGAGEGTGSLEHLVSRILSVVEAATRVTGREGARIHRPALGTPYSLMPDGGL